MLAAIVGISAWSPWASHERAHELAWIERYASWHDTIGRELPHGRKIEVSRCRARFDRRVGRAPSALSAVYEPARRSCVAFAGDDPLNAWSAWRSIVIGSLVKSHTQAARTTYEPRFSTIANSMARRKVRVYCWTEHDWEPLAEQWDALRRDEFYVAGIATRRQHRIDLASSVCEPLHAFYAGGFVPYMTEEHLGYAEGLVTLAHESEHMRQPTASEAVVECHALQRVREVRAAGHGARYQAERAGLALGVSYPNLPDEYRARDCYSGGPYDLHPSSKTWP